MAEDERGEIGRRMKQAAQAVGLTSKALGKQVGVEDGTIRGWWRGRGQPDPQKLLAYARAVGKSTDYLLTGAETANRGLPEWLLQFAKLSRQGMDPATALETVSQEGAEPDDLTGLERLRLSRAGPEIVADLQRASGGRWDELSEAQQAEVLELIRRRADADEAA